MTSGADPEETFRARRRDAEIRDGGWSVGFCAVMTAMLSGLLSPGDALAPGSARSPTGLPAWHTGAGKPVGDRADPGARASPGDNRPESIAVMTAQKPTDHPPSRISASRLRARKVSSGSAPLVMLSLIH